MQADLFLLGFGLEVSVSYVQEWFPYHPIKQPHWKQSCKISLCVCVCVSVCERVVCECVQCESVLEWRVRGEYVCGRVVCECVQCESVLEWRVRGEYVCV